MQINISNHGNHVCLEPIGRIDHLTAPELEKEVLSCIEQNQNCIIDFRSVPYISSAGLRVIMVAAKKSQGKNITLALCQMQQMVKEVFEISGFNTILNIYENVNEAKKPYV